MATTNRLKSALEEALNFVKTKASGATNTVRQVANRPAQTQQTKQAQPSPSFQNFQQNFSRGYEEFKQQQSQKAQVAQRSMADFTNNVIRQAPQQVLKMADEGLQSASPLYKNGRISLKVASDSVKKLDTKIPGGFKGGVQRVQQSLTEDPGQYWIGRGFADIVPNTKGALTPFVGEQTAEDIGYGLQGAGNLTPFNITNKMGLAGKETKARTEANKAITERQQEAEDIGQALYGTAMTAPIGGWKAVASRGLQGTVLGLAMGTAGTVLTEGRLPTKEELTKYGVNGLENSWQLAFTDALTNKVLGKFSPALTSEGLDQTFNILNNASKMGLSDPIKRTILAKGMKDLFLRALAEVPAENTMWTAIDQLDGDAKASFIQEWMTNLPGNILGNLAFGTLNAGARGTMNYNRADIDAALESIKKVLSNQSGFINAGEFVSPYKRGDIKQLDDLINEKIGFTGSGEGRKADYAIRQQMVDSYLQDPSIEPQFKAELQAMIEQVEKARLAKDSPEEFDFLYGQDKNGIDQVSNEQRLPDEMISSADIVLASNAKVKQAQEAFNTGDAQTLIKLAEDFPQDTRISALAEQMQKEAQAPLDTIQKDMAQSLEQQKIETAQAEAKTPILDPEAQRIQAEMQGKVFGEETVKEVEQKLTDGDKLLEDMNKDFEKARKLRTEQKDFPSLLGRIKTAMSDRFWYAQQTDKELYTNLRLLAGGDTRTASLINRAVGPILHRQAKEGTAEGFSQLLALDRLNELVDRGLIRKYNKEQIQNMMIALESKYTPEQMSAMREDAQKVRGFLAYLLDKAVESGLVSKEGADAARANNEFYVAFESIGALQRKVEKEGFLSTRTTTSGKSYNVARQEVLKNIGNSESGIADPVESMLKYMATTIHNMDTNSVLKDFVERRNGDGSGLVIPMRQAENVRERIRMNTEIGELKPLQRKLQRMIGTQNKQLKELEKQLDNLNLEGINLSLRGTATEFTPGRLGRVLETRVARLRNLDKELEGLNLEGLGISLQREPNVAEGSSFFKKTGGKFESGKDQYTKVEIPPRIKAVINQMVQMPEAELRSILKKIQTREGKVSGLVDEILDIKDSLRMQKFVDELVSLPSGDIERIKRKIELREGKVPPVLDTIKGLSDELEAVKDDIISLRRERGEIMDDKNIPEDYGVINVFRDGIKEEWAVPKEIEVAVKNLDAQASGWLIDKVLSPINQLFKQAVTSKNPVFVLAVNPLKDIQHALFAESTKNGYLESGKLAWNYLGGLSDAARLSDLRERWAISSAGQSGFLAQEMRVDPTKAAKQLQGGGFNKKFTQVLKSPFELLDYLGRTTEETTRLAKFRKDFAQLSPEAKASLDDPFIPLAQLPPEVRRIALESRDITQDFSRMGTFAQQINKVIPFFNPALQGTLKLGAMAKDNPVRFTTTMIAMTAIPSLVAYMNNRQFEDYQDLREYEKRGNMIWITKDRTPEEIAEGKPLHGYKIPLAQMTAPFYGLSEMFYKYVDSEEPQALSEFAKEVGIHALESIAEMSPVGGISSLTPPLLKVPIQLGVNQDLYSGMPVEPDYIDTDGDKQGDTPREEVPSAYREGYYTGPTTRTLGRITGPTVGLSPAQLDNIISTSMGGLGKTLIAGSDTLLGEPPKTERNPILSRFMAPRAGQIQQDERELEKQEQKQIMEEEFGKGVNFDNLRLGGVLGEQVNASTDMPGESAATVVKPDYQSFLESKGIQDTPENKKLYDKLPGTKLPNDTESLGVLYDDAEGIISKYNKAKTKIEYGEYASETKRRKELNELEAEFTRANEIKKLIEETYPKQVFEIGLDVYGEGTSRNVEERGDWAYDNLSKAQTKEEVQDIINQMWDKGVLTKSANGVASYIEEVYGIDVSNYTGTNPKTAKKVGSGSGSGKEKKIPKLDVNIPKINTPQIRLGGSSEYGKNISSLYKALDLPSGSKKLKIKVPKAEQIELPKRQKISLDIAPMRTRLKGL